MSVTQCWNQRPRAVVVAWMFFLALFFHLALITTGPTHLHDPRPVGGYPSLQQQNNLQLQHLGKEGQGVEGDSLQYQQAGQGTHGIEEEEGQGVNGDSLQHQQVGQSTRGIEEEEESYSTESNSAEDVLRKKTKNYGSSVVVHLNTTWNNEVAAARQEVYTLRRGRVASICKKSKAFQRSLDKVYRTILWDQQDQLMWCPILKAASTTWMKNFAHLAKTRNTTPEKGKKKKMRAKSHQIYKKPKDAESMLKSALKFIIVRHPFQRLLSAYRDKMLAEKSADGHFKHLQYNITKHYQMPYFKSLKRRKRRSQNKKENKKIDVSKHKQSGNRNNEKDTIPRCEDLTPHYSTNDANITVYLKRDAHQGVEWIHPTFTQFLMRVRDDMRQMWRTGGACVINKHWLPYWVSCDPCHVDYDVIAKVETNDLDTEYIIQKSKLQGEFINMHTHSAISDGFKSTSEAIKHYFSEVPVELLREIVDLYKPDFQLFDYDPLPFLKLGKS